MLKSAGAERVPFAGLIGGQNRTAHSGRDGLDMQLVRKSLAMNVARCISDLHSQNRISNKLTAVLAFPLFILSTFPFCFQVCSFGGWVACNAAIFMVHRLSQGAAFATWLLSGGVAWDLIICA